MHLPATDMKYSSYALPDLASGCNYSLRFNRYHQGVSAETKRWFFRLISPSQTDLALYDAQRFTLLAAVCYPDAGYPQLRVCSDFLAYFFYLDNLTDDMDNQSIRSVADLVLNSLHEPEACKSRYRIGRMTSDYFKRIMQTSTEDTRKRFIDTMDRFFKNVDDQARHRLAGHIPDLESYISSRRETSGCKTCFSLIEYANNLHIPDEVIYHPHIEQMETAANDVVSFANDIFSYNIEQAKGDTHNMIPVIMHANPNLDLLEAVDFVRDLTVKAMNRFNQLRAVLPSWGEEIDRDVKVYVNGLENWMIGILFWSFETERYFGRSVQSVKATKIVNLIPAHA